MHTHKVDRLLFAGTFPGHGNSSNKPSRCMQKAAADAAGIIQRLSSPLNNTNLLR